MLFRNLLVIRARTKCTSFFNLRNERETPTYRCVSWGKWSIMPTIRAKFQKNKNNLNLDCHFPALVGKFTSQELEFGTSTHHCNIIQSTNPNFRLCYFRYSFWNLFRRSLTYQCILLTIFAAHWLLALVTIMYIVVSNFIPFSWPLRKGWNLLTRIQYFTSPWT